MLTADADIDRRIVLQADSLRRAGWSVEILAPARGEANATLDPPGVRRAAVRETGAATAGRALRAYRWMRKRAPGIADFIQRRAYASLTDPFDIYSALLGPDALATPTQIVVAHDLPMLGLAADCAHRFGAWLVYDSHELFAEQGFPTSALDRMVRIERELVGRCDAVITVNESIAEVLERRYDLPRVEVILNAAYPHQKSPSGRLRRAFQLDDETRIVLLQGVLSPGRNLQTLVRSASVLRGQRAVLVFLGDGSEASALLTEARKAGVGDLVYLHPRVPQDELLDITAEAALGVIPYQPNCENNRLCTPNKLFEFIAAGVPVVATDLPELRRFVADEEIGIVGDTSNYRSLAALIEEALDDSNRLAMWRMRVLRLAQTRVNWEIEAARLIGIYQGLKLNPPRSRISPIS